jgi:hypothetical protein
MSRHLVEMAAALAVVGLLAGCGGGDSDDEPAAGTDTSGAAAAGNGSGGESEEWCQFARELVDGLDEAATLSVFDPESLQELYVRVETALDRAADAAPAEIADEVATLGEGFDRLVEVLEEADWDIARVAPEDIAVLDDESLLQAADRIQSYSAQECGIAPDTTGAESSQPPATDVPAAALDRVVSALTDLGFGEEDARCIAENVLGGDGSRLDQLLSDFPEAVADACGLSLQDLARIMGGG